MSKFPIVVMISGNGSNLQAIMDQCVNVEIQYVISDKRDAYGLERASRRGFPTMIIEQLQDQGREDYCDSLVDFIDPFNPGLIVLAGFMKFLTPNFVNTFRGRIINIHPSLLPKYKGLHTHKRVLEAGETVHGITIHMVDEKLDNGQTLMQVPYDVHAHDTVETLEKRSHEYEHIWYPTIIDEIAENWRTV
jgi:phosphoribosylglycinamide formyltransferase-1